MAKVIPIWRRFDVQRACKALVFPFGQRGQEHSGQDGNDGHDHQQLDEREGEPGGGAGQH